MVWTTEKLKKFYKEASEILEELESIKNDSKSQLPRD